MEREVVEETVNREPLCSLIKFVDVVCRGGGMERRRIGTYDVRVTLNVSIISLTLLILSSHKTTTGSTVKSSTHTPPLRQQQRDQSEGNSQYKYYKYTSSFIRSIYIYIIYIYISYTIQLVK